jgi:hypothetical protein
MAHTHTTRRHIRTVAHPTAVLAGTCLAETGGLKFGVAFHPGEFRVSPRGRLIVPAVIDHLGRILGRGPIGWRLCLDLARASGLDMATVRALIHVLHDHCRRYSPIVITNLPEWVVQRLLLRGAPNLLGGGWRSTSNPTEIEFLGPTTQ